MIFTSKNGSLQIYFGDKSDPFVLQEYNKHIRALSEIKKNLNAKSLTFLNQVHGIKGHWVSSQQNTIELLKREGDYLIADTPGHAIGVMTADCLPIVIYDPKKDIVSVVHAGWRSSVNGIVQKAIKDMRSKPEDIQAYFGSSAKACCYEVSKDFYKNLTRYQDECFIQRKQKCFFDNVRFNRLLLLDLGVVDKNINMKCNLCTICNDSFHSYRRDAFKSGRQATVVVLK